MEQNKKEGIASAYSADGYLVDQSRITDVPYGCRTSNQNGCGWIALYNLLRNFGEPVPHEALTRALSRHALFGGLLGTSPLRIRRYLRRHGHPMDAALGLRRVIAASERASAGILMYRHRGGWHFVAFGRQAGELLRFYNAVPGAEAYDRTMARFLQEQNRAKIVWMLYAQTPATEPSGSA